MFYISLRFEALSQTMREIDQGVKNWSRQTEPDAPHWMKNNRTDNYLYFQAAPTRLRYIVGTEPLPEE